MNKKKIEDWKLTAYALGELETEDADAIEAALEGDASLREQLASIRSTLDKVSAALTTVAPMPLTSEQTERLRASIKSSQQTTLLNAASAVKPSSNYAVTTTDSRRTMWLGLTALAASVTAVVVFSGNLLRTSDTVSMESDFVAPASSVPSLAKEQKDEAIVMEKTDALSVENGLESQARSVAPANEPASVAFGSSDAASARGAAGPTADFDTQFFQNSFGSSAAETQVDKGLPLSKSVDDSESMSLASEPATRFQLSDSSGSSYGAGDGSSPSGYGAGYDGGGGGYGGNGRGYGLSQGQTVSGEDLAPSEGTRTMVSGYDSNMTTDYTLPSGEVLEGLARRRLLERPSAMHSYDKRIKQSNESLVEGDRFESIVETPFQKTAEQSRTTFSIDVDTAAYSKIRQAIMEAGRLPNPDAVRIEEMLNYFSYDYAGPQDDRPFAAHLAATTCPWTREHKLVRIALQAKHIENKNRPVSNLVFLLDVSGSMNEPNKLPLVKKAISMLARQLGENDRVAIVVYAGAAGLVLPSTTGNNQQAILTALDDLQAGGSTNGGEGIQLAYEIARQYFIQGGVNRVILCTDGDFNVGVTGDDTLTNLVEANAKQSNVFLSVFGFGMGNFNDSMMEKITNKGNGTYAMIDSELEARKHMVEQINSTLITVAKDVKIQVDFNPAYVAAYRLIGYENRKLANRDFNDDTKDAGEIGAGHSVTVLYEIVPAGQEVPGDAPPEDPLRYENATADGASESGNVERPSLSADADAASEFSSELLFVKLRYKKPDSSVSTRFDYPLLVDAYEQPIDSDFRWASSIAKFGMLLRGGQNAQSLSWSDVIEQATMAAGDDSYRLEAVELMRRSQSMPR